jgi:hypothetical protein
MSQNDTVSQMLQNHQADTWNDVDTGSFDNDERPPLARLQSYVDYCFDHYSVVSNNLDRDSVQCCIADWGRRRGQARIGREMDRQTFGKRVPSSAENYVVGTHALFLAEALVGVAPDEDNGVGWKACVRHELGHMIDYEQRGECDHGPKFKAVMEQFGHDNNDGQSTHGYMPRVFR